MTLTSISASGSSDMPKIKIDSSNNAVAVWESFDGSIYSIQASKKTNGADWTAPQTISKTGRDSVLPSIAMDSKGNVVAIWMSFDKDHGINFIESAILPTEGVWSSANIISSPTENPMSDYQVAINDNGTFMITWGSYVGLSSNSEIRVATGLITD